MRSSLCLILLFSFALLVQTQTDSCTEPTYIIPYESLDNVFDQGISAVRSQQNLVTLIQEPNQTNVRNYILSLAPFSAPLFAFAAISFVLFLAMIIQVICFNTCGKECCGNELTTTTYNVCCIRAMVITFIIISFILMALSIAAIIVNSDLQYAVQYTTCNTQNILSQAYDGNSNETIPWSGVNNFDDDINTFSVNIQNVVPNLAIYFSSSNSIYNDIIDISTTTTPYNLSQTYNCENASGFTITCPFEDTARCPGSYQAQFTLNFCDVDATGSAKNLISEEMSQNSTTWRSNIIGLGQTLDSVNLNQQNIDTLTNDITSFTNSIVDYEQTLEDGFDTANNVNYGIQIGLYVLFSFLLALSIAGMTTICCTYYCNNYSCNCMTYIWWLCYSLMAILMFVAAGLFLGGSFFIYDSCSAYPYYFTNQTQFNELTFANDQVGQIFETCFFDNSQSMFTAFEDSTVLTDFTTLKEEYQLAVPSAYFSSVVSSIENTLANYQLNPETITIADVNTTDQPQAALESANVFANYSATGSTQSCNVTKDRLTFNVADCYPYLTNQEAGENSCIVLSANEQISDVLTNRSNAFDDANCSNQGTIYVDNAQALFDYRLSINNIVSDLYSIPDSPTNPLQAYEDNYFSYYANVRNFFNQGVQELFESFFDPYDRLYEGSSCGFITTSMDGIINISCNQLFPYFNILSALAITISVMVFVLFILAYFLTTRFQFYEFLDGNWENWGEQSYKTKQLPQTYGYQMDSTNRNQQLMSNNNKYY